METVTTEKLKDMRQQGDDVAIVDVLSEEAYRGSHLPGAINVPLQGEFESDIQQAVPDKSRPVVLYCADEDCPASAEAAKKMEALGYETVYDYEGGKQAWRQDDGSLIAGPNPGGG